MSPLGEHREEKCPTCESPHRYIPWWDKERAGNCEHDWHTDLLLKEAKRLVEAELPEDEQDYTPDWIYRLVLFLGVRATLLGQGHVPNFRNAESVEATATRIVDALDSEREQVPHGARWTRSLRIECVSRSLRESRRSAP